ncbi:MAG: type VI secretion system amidase effector protein Tae4 [Candidatus Methylumidiphilus sp.]
MSNIEFDFLWGNHPAVQDPPNINPCSTNGTPNFTNQCAIRFGVCLTNSGISLDSFPGAFCWHGHGSTHPIRVEELMHWLNSTKVSFVGIAGISKRDKRGRKKSSTSYSGRRGIIVFRNFWGINNQGDHIDLWDGSLMTHGDNSYFEPSQEIWFWDM